MKNNEVVAESGPTPLSTAEAKLALINERTLYNKENLTSISTGMADFDAWEKSCLTQRFLLKNKDYAEMLCKIGTFYQDKSDNEKATLYLEPAFEVLDFLEHSQQIVLKKQLAKLYAETTLWLFKAKEIYKELRSLPGLDEKLKYEIELNFSFYLKQKGKYDKCEKLLRETLQSLQKTNHPDLLARCYSEFGHYYIDKINHSYTHIKTIENNKKSLKKKLTKAQKNAERQLPLKKEDIADLTKNAISFLKDALNIVKTEGDHLAVIHTTLAIANLANKESIQNQHREIIQDVYQLYHDHLPHLQPKKLHLSTFHRVNLCLAKLLSDCPYIFRRFNLLDESKKILQDELIYLEKEYGKSCPEYQEIFKQIPRKRTTSFPFFDETKPQNKGIVDLTNDEEYELIFSDSSQTFGTFKSRKRHSPSSQNTAKKPKI